MSLATTLYPNKKPISQPVSLPGLPPTGSAANRRFSTGIPGEEGLYLDASRNVGDLLAGEESPDITRNINAEWGAGSGLAPGSEFMRNRGADLYGQRAAARKSQGMKDLLAMMGTFSGTVTATPGQVLGDEAAQRSYALDQQQFAEQQRQFNESLANQKAMEQARLDLENERFQLDRRTTNRRFKPNNTEPPYYRQIYGAGGNLIPNKIF
jgi:hypothetical protein